MDLTINIEDYLEKNKIKINPILFKKMKRTRSRLTQANSLTFKFLAFCNERFYRSALLIASAVK